MWGAGAKRDEHVGDRGDTVGWFKERELQHVHFPFIMEEQK